MEKDMDEYNPAEENLKKMQEDIKIIGKTAENKKTGKKKGNGKEERKIKAQKKYNEKSEDDKVKSVFIAIIKIIIVLAIVAILTYIVLPPINIKSKNFYFVIFVALGLIVLLNVGALTSYDEPGSTICKIAGAGVIGIVFIYIIGSLLGSAWINAKAYAKVMEVDESGTFYKDISEANMNQIPVVDRDSAERLGSRKLGEMSELVSQFVIKDNYTQINYNGVPYRVTPLGYGGLVKWFNNYKEGIPAYIMINMVTQEAELVWLDEGMKYSPDDHFSRNIYRYLRKNYPSYIFGTLSFEIDDDGVPYWIAPVLEYKVGLWNGSDVNGIVLVNAVSGEHLYYDVKDVPEWVDQVYNSSMLIKQLNAYEGYQDGYINYRIGQKNVKRTTSGYNYLAIDNDVYLYTGITSVMSDESNIGFVLINLRTKNAKFYSVPGATETSAMASAQGKVQQMNYTSTFPILLNISERPTYFMSLKDGAGLVKMYAFVDAQQYQIVGTGNTIALARQDYRESLQLENIEDTYFEDFEETEKITDEAGNEIVNKDEELIEKETIEETEAQPAEIKTVAGTITKISFVSVSGDTYCYFMLDNGFEVYSAPVTLNSRISFMENGTWIEFEYIEDSDPLLIISIINMAFPEEIAQ